MVDYICELMDRIDEFGDYMLESVLDFTEKHPFIVFLFILLFCGLVLGLTDEASVR